MACSNHTKWLRHRNNRQDRAKKQAQRGHKPSPKSDLRDRTYHHAFTDTSKAWF